MIVLNVLASIAAIGRDLLSLVLPFGWAVRRRCRRLRVHDGAARISLIPSA